MPIVLKSPDSVDQKVRAAPTILNFSPEAIRRASNYHVLILIVATDSGRGHCTPNSRLLAPRGVHGEWDHEPDPTHGHLVRMAGGSLAEGLKLSLRPTPTGSRVHGSGTLLSPLFLEGSDVPAARKERRLFLCVTDAEAFTTRSKAIVWRC
jgi:hypothetical protein